MAWAGLLLLQLIWHASIAPPANGQIGLALLLVLPPLLLPLLALRRGPRRALLWVGIVSLGYFCHGVVAAWSIPEIRSLAMAEIALSLVLIGTLGWVVQADRQRMSEVKGGEQ